MESMKPIVIVGSINTDLVVRTPRLPAPGETLHANSFSTFTGGKGANQAATVARLGGKAMMLGLVGNDMLGERLVQDLIQAGVDTSMVSRVDGSSGVAVITVTAQGQNAILLAAGANGHLEPEVLYAHRDQIVGAGLVLTQLETPLATLGALVKLCTFHGVPLMLDPAPAQVLNPEIIRAVTWLTPNETEAEVIFGVTLRDMKESDLHGLADQILRDGPRNLLLKLGGRGAYLATGEGVRRFIPAFPVSVVDTTAAGDCFNGAFALRLNDGDDACSAARFAAAAAAISATRHGALPSLPTEAEVRECLQSAASSLKSSEAIP